MASHHLTCSLCLDKYDTKDRMPKSLPCLHSFCRQCLVLFLENHRDESNLPCPICREVFPQPENGVDGLHTNFMLRDLIHADDSPPLADTEKSLLVRTILERKLADTKDTAVRAIAETTTRIQLEVATWQAEMLQEIDKVNENLKEVIAQGYKEVGVEVMNQNEEIENTTFSYLFD